MLPQLNDGERVAVLLSGGSSSTLLTYLAIQKYGVDNVITVFSPSHMLVDILRASTPAAVAKEQIKLDEAQKGYRAVVAALGVEHSVELMTRESYDYDGGNMIDDFDHGPGKNRPAFLSMLQRHGFDSSTISFVLFGFTKYNFDIVDLYNKYEVSSASFDADLYNEISSAQSTYQDLLDAFPNKFTKSTSLQTQVSQIAVYMKSIVWHPQAMIDDIAQNGGAPFMNLSREDVYRYYVSNGLTDLLDTTMSCNNTYPIECGICRSCMSRSKILARIQSTQQ